MPNVKQVHKCCVPFRRTCRKTPTIPGKEGASARFVREESKNRKQFVQKNVLKSKRMRFI